MRFLQPEWRDRVPSTNAAVLAAIRSRTVPEGYVLAAREQTAGRGRYQRRWVSEAGRDLAFSCVIGCCRDRSDLTGLPMAAALAVAGRNRR